MKKTLLLACVACAPALLNAQGAMDGYTFSQRDLKGTARYMSMGGAFGALGGDLSVMSQNPGGIGIFRRNEIGFTIDLDCQRSTSLAQGMKSSDTQTKFLLNNIGAVFTMKMNNQVMRNLNFGFSYQKAASFNRKYSGSFNQLSNSMSNYIAGVANSNSLTVGDVESTSDYDPYNPTDGGYTSPWIAILGYDSYLISPVASGNDTAWYGQWGNGTSGSGYFNVLETGGVDEYNLSFGGNISDIFFWGMDFGIIDMNYRAESLWGENLNGAYVDDGTQFSQTTSEWSLYNDYIVKGNGFNYKLGFIVKPIQELRLGFAFHTPTWYSIEEAFYGDVEYKYDNSLRPGNAQTNNGDDGYNSYNFRTPWRFIFSAAGVIGNRVILSADYEFENNRYMHFYDAGSMWSYDGGRFADTNYDITRTYKGVSTFRVGAEFRATDEVSLRAGFVNSSSPVEQSALNGQLEMYPSGTRPSFSLDNSTRYITCGVGYRTGKFSCDLAYVYKNRSSEYFAYPTDVAAGISSVPHAEITTSHSQIVLSASFRF